MLDYPSRNGSHCNSRVPDPGVASLTSIWSPAATCAEAWNAAVCQAGDEVAKSWVKFVGERLAKDSTFPQQFAACRNPSDICDLYAKFWQQMAGDYAAEFSSIASTGWKAARAFLDAAGNGNSASKTN
ncbi:hypothetical protein HYPDE_25623 [Hyphomicrobium denitrificans 1NES1]|uniref:Phasin domain-containing protein n=1 Tax=Hyphomicrobium denitrificans 1NES1 TaxID=670307 RepID=N0B031_9HYPH|nr:hypothetical protein [Hyphomicrobium denitrificans]AGK56809.1 hypothetical protein HYPDE_25623 [Hyphomicrobium denitrificans 1NES1]